jgi:hypothetical protein
MKRITEGTKQNRKGIDKVEYRIPRIRGREESRALVKRE